jgi:NCAIR mutase (PurE)-related protein
MTPSDLLQLLAAVESGKVTAEAAATRLATLPFEDLGHTRVDHHRSLRTGLPEVIYAAGKTPEQTAAIFDALVADGVDVLATRANQATADAVLARHPQAIYNPAARTLALRQRPAAELKGHIAVLCAGTSDLPVAEEAAVTAETFGVRVTRLYDVGVAGVHRLLAVREQLTPAGAVIVCAGMEGALPSVVGGLVGVPVIAVPTSVGYGASFGGASALLGMLNSCSPNVSVVNIDNGFGAAYIAVLIARAAAR